AEGLVAWARILWSGGELDEALEVLDLALPDATTAGRPRLQVHAYNLLGLVHGELGHLDTSLGHHEQALDAAERAAIQDAITQLERAAAGTNPSLIHAQLEILDHATKPWAGRRMDRAVAKAIAGKQVEAVEEGVAAARGVDAHVEEHAARRAP
ncbi:MAG: hypothetical protein JNM07_14175, partial [Phycisphaerae bacterium]|nr:hypothetical protein [Phycisphaerae bacterium]